MRIWEYWPITFVWRGWKDRYKFRHRGLLGWHGWSNPINGKHGWMLHLWVAGIRFGRNLNVSRRAHV